VPQGVDVIPTDIEALLLLGMIAGVKLRVKRYRPIKGYRRVRGASAGLLFSLLAAGLNLSLNPLPGALILEGVAALLAVIGILIGLYEERTPKD
jgi:hypothetical protein